MPAGTSIVDTLLAGSSPTNASAAFAKNAQRPKPLNPGPVAAAGAMNTGGHRSPSGAQGRQAKLFIGGISRHTTTKQLRDHFMKYGRVIDCVAMKEADGRSRGFGYVTFSSQAACDRVLSEAQNIDGRIVDVKRAVPEALGGAPSFKQVPESAFLGGPMASDLTMSGSHAIWQGMFGAGAEAAAAAAADPWSWADYSMGSCALDDFAMSAFGMAAAAAARRQPDCLELLSSGGALPPTPTTARQHLQNQGALVLGTTPLSNSATDATGAPKCMSAEAAEFVPTKESKKQQPAKPATKPRKVLGEISSENSANIMKNEEDDAKKPMFIKVSQPLEENKDSNLPLPAGGLQTSSAVSKLNVLTTFDDASDNTDDKDTEGEEKQEAAKAVSQEELDALGSCPSIGSLLHDAGECKRCNFFAKGRCENGKACQFCHYPHEKRKATRQEKRQRERQQALLGGRPLGGLNIETEFDDELSGLGSPQDDGFLGLPPVLTSQPGSVTSAYSGLLSPAFSGVSPFGALPAAPAPPGLAGPAALPMPAWQPEEDLNPALISAIADAIAQQAVVTTPTAAGLTSPAAASFLSTAPPSKANPLATPAMMANAEEAAEAATEEEPSKELPEGDASNVWSREDMLRILSALEATGSMASAKKKPACSTEVA